MPRQIFLKIALHSPKYSFTLACNVCFASFLLGSPPDIDNEDEVIPTVFEKLNIKEGPFHYEEYREAKASLVEGKSCGEDGVAPEVLKRV